MTQEDLKKCCGSEKWVSGMFSETQVFSVDETLSKAEEIWNLLSSEDRLEAFEYHPKIGDMNSLREKYSHSKDLSESEQSGAADATDEILIELAEMNENYEKKFGFIFIVFATGKSAGEMLSILKKRINNNAETEMKNASEEQLKITKLRLKNYYESDHNTRT
ncbi:MAG: 2-oxo-4-hydroxy-4-carboxy-5-ureidoimidazoline decarboxylase [Ignavibacteria bacterium]